MMDPFTYKKWGPTHFLLYLARTFQNLTLCLKRKQPKELHQSANDKNDLLSTFIIQQIIKRIFARY